MLSKEFFLRVCRYANANWKANLSEMERVVQAEEMLEEYSASKADRNFTHSMEVLIENLTEDITENADSEAEDILNTIMEDFRNRKTH